MVLSEWLRRLPAFAPDGEGDGTGADSVAASKDGAGDAGAGKSGAGSILDEADKTPGADEGDGEKKAEGEAETGVYDPGKLPDGVLGKSDKETIDALLARHNDLRREISKGKHKDAADIPDVVDGYKIEAKDDKDVVALAVNAEDAGAIMATVRKAALVAKMGQGQFNDFVRSFMEEGGDVGLLMSDEDATRINGQSEMAELKAIAGSEKAAKEIVNSVTQYGERLIGLGVMTKDDMAEWKTMFGTARSSLIMHKVLTDIAGFKPVPLEGARGEGTVTANEAYAMQSKALSMAPGDEKNAELARVAKVFERVFGTSPASDSTEARRSAAM